MPPKRDLFVICAVDADVIGQILSGRPRWNRARWDASFDSLRRLYTRVELIVVEHGGIGVLSVQASNGVRKDVVNTETRGYTWIPEGGL